LIVCIREYLMTQFSGEKEKKRGDYGVAFGFLLLYFFQVCSLWINLDHQSVVITNRVDIVECSCSFNTFQVASSAYYSQRSMLCARACDLKYFIFLLFLEYHNNCGECHYYNQHCDLCVFRYWPGVCCSIDVYKPFWQVFSSVIPQ